MLAFKNQTENVAKILQTLNTQLKRKKIEKAKDDTKSHKTKVQFDLHANLFDVAKVLVEQKLMREA